MNKTIGCLIGYLVTLLFAHNASAQNAILVPESITADKLHSHIHAPGEINEEQAPFIIDVTYTADLWRAARGGVREGTRYLDNLDIVAEANLERLIGWLGAEVHVYSLYNNGKSLNELMGDAQVASNIETGVQAFRLYEAWIDQRISGKASIKLGLYDLNSEFDALDSSGLFMGSAHGIGTDISQSGLNGPSIFPSTSLAARVEVEPAQGWKLRAAVLDGVPGDSARPKRTAIKLGNGDGALIIGEVEVPIADGKLLFGHWRYTARFDNWTGGRKGGNDGWYLRGERQLKAEPNEPGQGLSGFFRLGIADGSINPFNHFASAGLNYTGLFDGRDGDQLGFAAAAALTSKEYRLTSTQAKSETVFELTYRASVADWLTIQPNVQYVLNPGADPTRHNALAFGLRTELNYRYSR